MSAEVAATPVGPAPEPAGRRARWRAEVLDGAPLADVVAGAGGIAGWLWTEWGGSVADERGFEAFAAVALGYRRELWLWMVGDRTWEQCSVGLVGRLGRRRRCALGDGEGVGQQAPDQPSGP